MSLTVTPPWTQPRWCSTPSGFSTCSQSVQVCVDFQHWHCSFQVTYVFSQGWPQDFVPSERNFMLQYIKDKSLTQTLHLNNKQISISKLTDNTLPTQDRYQLNNIFRKQPAVSQNLRFIQNAKKKVYRFEKGGIRISKRTSKCQEIKSHFHYPEYKGRKTLRNIYKKLLPTRRLVSVTAISSETETSGSHKSREVYSPEYAD